MFNDTIRPRRLRTSDTLRRMVRETRVSADSDGSASTGARDMEILSGQILLGVREGQQRYKRQQQSNRFFHDVLSPSRFQPERLFPQGLVEEGRSGSGLAHDQLSFCPVFRAPA